MRSEFLAATQDALARVAANLRHWREARGLTQAHLAAAIEVEPLTIRSIEGRRQKPRFTTLAKIACVLEIDVSELFMRREAERRTPGRPPKK